MNGQLFLYLLWSIPHRIYLQVEDKGLWIIHKEKKVEDVKADEILGKRVVIEKDQTCILNLRTYLSLEKGSKKRSYAWSRQEIQGSFKMRSQQ